VRTQIQVEVASWQTPGKLLQTTTVDYSKFAPNSHQEVTRLQAFVTSHALLQKKTGKKMTKITQIEDKGATIAWSPCRQHPDIIALGTKVSQADEKKILCCL